MTTYTEKTDHRSRLLTGLAQVLETKTLAELYADDIVREASVSKRTFYQHFKNKQECFLALYEENSAYIVSTLIAATDDDSISIVERIERGTTAYLTAMQEQAPLMKRLYIDVLTLGSEGLAARRRVIDLFVQRIEEFYAEEKRRHPNLPALPRELVTGTVAGLNELILYRIEDGKADSLVELASTTRDMMMAGMQMLVMRRG
jgi:AcrR family transcriptional regulator